MAEEDTKQETEPTEPEDFTKFEVARRAEEEGKNPPAAGAAEEKPKQESQGDGKTSEDAGQPERQAGDQEPPTEAKKEAGSEADPDKPKRKGGWQRKIEALERSNAELTARLEESRLAAPAAGEKPKAEPKAKEPVKRLKRPNSGDFDNDDALEAAEEEFFVGLGERGAQTVIDKQREIDTAEKAKQERSEAEKTVFAAHEKRAVEFAIQHADFNDVIAGATEIIVPGAVTDPGSILGAILESEASAELTYHYAKNPDELNELIALPPPTAIRRLGRLEAKLQPDGQGQTAGYTPPPEPLKKVEGGTTPLAIDGNLPFNEFEQRRRAGAQPTAG